MDKGNQSGTDRGAFSTIGGKPGENMHYDTPAIQVGNQVRDGDEFVLVTRSRQGEGFQVWSSGDKQVTEQLYKQAGEQLGLRQPATT